MARHGHQTKTHQLLEKEEAQMNFEHYLSDAEEMVSAWELSDSELPLAIQRQAELMAGLELYWGEIVSSNPSHETFTSQH